MIQPSNGNGKQTRGITNSARNMGVYVLGGRGTGKSWLLALVIAWQDFLVGRPQVIFDPLGTVSQYFFYKLVRTLSYLPKAKHAQYWERVKYCDLSGREGFVTPFPLYYRQGSETLQEIAERVLTVIQLSSPGLVANAPVSWPSMHRLGVHAGTVLAALGLQATQLEDLLFNTASWQNNGLFDEEIRRFPEDAVPAMSYFRTSYLPLSRTDKSRLVSSLFDHVFKLTSDRNLRGVFAASAFGIKWKDVAANGQTVILNFKQITAPETKRFALLWTFMHLYEFIKQRSRSDLPFGVIFDEFAAFAAKVEHGMSPLATVLDEFIQQYMRNSNIWLTIAHQTIQQLDEQLRTTLLSLGNYLFGQAPTMEAARILADAVFLRDPYRVKYWRPVYGRIVPRGSDIPEEPQFMPLEEQRELFAQQLRKLPAQQFLLRPAEREGVISTAVFPITIRSVDLDPVTNEYHYPDPDLLNKLYPILAQKDGRPIADILNEQEARLTQGIRRQPPQPTPAAEDSSR
jgi:hypothetical protein